MTGLYFCPTVREVESPTGGGFDVCCAHPELHLPMLDGPATEAVSMALAEAAKREYENARVLAQLLADWSREATPLHDKLARITLAAWNPDVDGNSFRELVRAVVGPVIRSGLDDPEYLATLRAECRRLGLPVADTAEEKVQRVREVAAIDALPPWVRQRLADALDPPPPACPRCHGHGKIPDWSQGLDPYYGEPKAKPCPECSTEETACS